MDSPGSGGFHAFLEASNDSDEESYDFRKSAGGRQAFGRGSSSGGGGFRGTNRGASEFDDDDDYGGVGGGALGASKRYGGMGYGGSYNPYDIDLGSLKVADRSGSKTPTGRGRGGRGGADVAASVSSSGGLRGSAASGRGGRDAAAAKAKPKAAEKTKAKIPDPPSDSESSAAGSSEAGDSKDKVAAPSVFASFQKEMQELRESAEQMRQEQARAEEEAKKAEEERKKKEAEEAERKKKEAEEEAERKKKEAEEAARKKKEEEEAETKRKEEEEKERKRKEQEEQARKKKKEEEAAAQKKKEEEEAESKRKAEEEERKKREEEALRKKAADEEALKKKQEVEAAEAAERARKAREDEDEARRRSSTAAASPPAGAVSPPAAAAAAAAPATTVATAAAPAVGGSSAATAGSSAGAAGLQLPAAACASRTPEPSIRQTSPSPTASPPAQASPPAAVQAQALQQRLPSQSPRASESPSPRPEQPQSQSIASQPSLSLSQSLLSQPPSQVGSQLPSQTAAPVQSQQTQPGFSQPPKLPLQSSEAPRPSPPQSSHASRAPSPTVGPGSTAASVTAASAASVASRAPSPGPPLLQPTAVPMAEMLIGPAESANSLTLYSSVVKNSLEEFPSAAAAAAAAPSQPATIPPSMADSLIGPAGPASDRWRLPCDDGKLLILRSTDSAEDEERSAFWRAQARKQLDASAGGDVSGARDISGARGTLDANASLMLGSTVLSDLTPGRLGFGLQATEAEATPLGGARFKTLRPEDFQAVELAEASLRSERTKVEAFQREMQGLKRKMVLLEEFNTELASLKAKAEAEAVRLDEQVMRLRLENRKLQDAAKSHASAVREAAEMRCQLEARLEATESQLGKRQMTVEQETAVLQTRQAKLSERIAALEQENSGLLEERDMLREDLALATGGRANGDKLPPPGSRAAVLAAMTAQRLEGPEDPAAARGAARSGTLVARLQAEVEMAEKMLQACEKENENLAQQNRQLRQGARLHREEVDGRQLQLVAELNAAKASADTNPASMRRVTELERELVAVKERAEEHMKELERCREAKRQLERELLTGPPQTRCADAQQRENLQQEEAKRAQAEAEVSELQEKLRYYAQSQQEMETDRQEVARLGEQIRALHSENADLRRRPGAKEANRRTAELRKQVDELQECLRKRHPDSILALMKAAEPPSEERKEVREMRAKVEELEAQLAERDVLYDRRVRSLRAQYDHMRHEYERRTEGGRSTVGDASAGAAAAPYQAREESRRAAPDREAVLLARIQDLERQVEHTKSYYLSKLRKREPLVPPSKPVRGASHGGPPADPRPAQQQQTQQLVQQLQQQLRQRDAELADLSAAMSRGPSTARPGAMTLRLFLSFPEAPGLLALCAEERCLARWARCGRFEEVASQAERLLQVLCASESLASRRNSSGSAAAAGMHDMGAAAGSHHVLGQQEDALRLAAVPALPSTAWSALRRCTERLQLAASTLSVHGCGGPRGEEVIGVVFGALDDLRNLLESILRRLLCSPAGADEEGSPPGQAVADSLLPRLSLEAACGALGAEATMRLVQDAETHAGLDHRLPWAELLAALRRADLPQQCMELCSRAASPDFSLSMTELRQLVGGSPLPSEASSSHAGLVHALSRIRRASMASGLNLQLPLQRLDSEGNGFVPRGDFLDALQGIPCALSTEERLQIAAHFSPAGDPRFVCYPLLLQSLVPEPGEEVPRSSAGRWAEPRQEQAQQQLEGLHSSLAKAQEENLALREKLRALEARCEGQAQQVAQLAADAPAQAVRRLQGEVALLESRVLEQQASAVASSRKAEISLRAELDVSRHEVATLKRSLDARDVEVRRYQDELEAIISELATLRAAPRGGS
eukprot:TRINITY_DN9412_c1_g1_i4.p1 TRINITY_DN9412_c1_g1~~TRINITY_DN9412_c1_g1_i4.p1  ORF type:complete len:1864 (+),score=558.09 TRINITY_DN9412_c1_g1_i4:73-5664(+)